MKAYVRDTVPAPGAEKMALPGDMTTSVKPPKVPSEYCAKFDGTTAPPVAEATARRLDNVLPSAIVQGACAAVKKVKLLNVGHAAALSGAADVTHSRINQMQYAVDFIAQ